MWGQSGRPTHVLNVCDLSSPTRIKSQRSHLSHIGGTVIPPCPVTTRSSVPGSTAQATSPGFLLLPPHQLWCQKDARAKLVPELEAPPPPSVTCNSSPPITGVTTCLPFPHLTFGSLFVLTQTESTCLSVFLSEGLLWSLSWCVVFYQVSSLSRFASTSQQCSMLFKYARQADLHWLELPHNSHTNFIIL